MIEEIAIRDLGVIAEARLALGAGFTAVTGETGAGKTMVVTALGLLRGERADAGAVRSGRDQAVVEGEWSVPGDGAVARRVRDAGGTLDDGEPGRAHLLLGRSVAAEGRSRAVVGGRSAPVGVLSELGERLVAVHGQADQVRLRSGTAQREALDRFAGEPLTGMLSEHGRVFEAAREVRRRLDELTGDRDRREREGAELRAALEEIEAAAPRRGEDEELAATAERLGNLEDLRLAALDAREAVSAQSGDGGADAVGRVDDARRALERVAHHDAALAPAVEAAAGVSAALADLSAQLSHYLAGLDTEGARELDAIQERRALLGTLARRFGPTLDDVVDLWERGSDRLLELDGDGDRIAALETEAAELDARLDALATRLTELRTKAADRLAAAVSIELSALAMPDARLVVEIDPREPSASGRDRVALALVPHPGAEPRPIGRGASGGELSRIMLALEVVLAGSDPVPTFVFDEVDAGVGGAAATEIGRRLARLAERAQVIVVTHLAQVAAFAGTHFAVVKSSDGSVTASDVRAVTGEDRVAEMARLLSGQPDSPVALEHARELLAASRGGGGVGGIR